MRLKFWKRKSNWENLGSVSFTVPAGRYKATTNISYQKGVIDKTIIVVPEISVSPTPEGSNKLGGDNESI